SLVRCHQATEGRVLESARAQGHEGCVLARAVGIATLGENGGGWSTRQRPRRSAELSRSLDRAWKGSTRRPAIIRDRRPVKLLMNSLIKWRLF
ncbi:MAG: hypothetical protein O7B35_17785, partial [Deltaproteobacteria bacterium]|nr:hypothetical protein [Deltaproteobacteria bacterium]